jgi:hypothetical protein
MPPDVLEIFDWIGYAFAGWRYLLSPSFRRRVHTRWKAEGRGKAFVEILFGALGVLLTLFLLWLVLDLLRG